MGIELTDLALDERTCVVTIGTQEAKITYRPSAITTGTMERLQKAEEAGDLGIITRFFSEIVHDWDVTKQGEKLPITEENLREVPLVVLQGIFMAIMRDSGRGEAQSTSSDG